MARRVAHIRNVHVILATAVGLILLVSSAFGWLGWKLLAQEENLIEQRTRARAEQSADVLLTGFLRRIAETEAWLSQIGSMLPTTNLVPDLGEGAILVRFSHTDVETQPQGQLLYYLNSPPWRPIDEAIFREADRLEFQTNDLRAAADSPEALIASRTAQNDPRIHAAPLLRLARVQNKTGQTSEALDTYWKLKDENLTSPAGPSYALLSRFVREFSVSDSCGAADGTDFTDSDPGNL